MTKQTHGKGFYKVNEYHADVPFLVAPKILKEIFIEGVKWYIVKGRRPCIAKDFDKFFKPNYVASGQSLD